MSQFDIQFTFNGETISAISGQSVGAALLAAKQVVLVDVVRVKQR